MDASVESVCNLLARTRLMTVRDVRAMHQRWRREAADSGGDLNRFGLWLVENEYVTNFQADRLLRGKTGHFFLGDYKVLDRIGQGHMASLYRAVHPLGPVVALKVLPPTRAGHPKGLARFQREGRIGLLLHHANVVRTYHTGESGGIHFIVQEFLEGETLSAHVKRSGSLSPREAAQIVQQALAGLQHIHEQRVVHRDLKPANLMIVQAKLDAGNPELPRDSALPAPSSVLVKIIDLGLARSIEEEGEPDPVKRNGLTTLGAVLGTPEYRAPEQERDAHNADVRADIYSLGCVLYHCLTGQPPFVDSDPRRRAERHAHEPPRPLKELNPAVPDALQDVVHGMLAKDPTYRYATPERAAAALEAFLETMREAPGPQVVAAKSSGSHQGQAAPVAAPAAVPVASEMVAGSASSVTMAPVALPIDSVAPTEIIAAEATPVVAAVPVATAVPAPAGAASSTLLLVVGLGAGIGFVLLLFLLGWRVLVAFAAGYAAHWLFSLLRRWRDRIRPAAAAAQPPTETPPR